MNAEYPFYVFKPERHVDSKRNEVVESICAKVVDLREKAIVNAVVDAARDSGITELILMDKGFILRAIKNELKKNLKEENAP